MAEMADAVNREADGWGVEGGGWGRQELARDPRAAPVFLIA